MKTFKTYMFNVIWITVCIILIIQIFMPLYDFNQVYKYGIPIEANITDHGTRNVVKNNIEYIVKYSFNLNNDSKTYSFVGGWYKKDDWCSIEKDEYNKVIKSKKIIVKYLSYNPWNNDAASELNLSSLVKTYIISCTINIILICIVIYNLYKVKFKMTNSRYDISTDEAVTNE